MSKDAMVSRFFTTKRTRGGVRLLHHGHDVASIYRDGANFWVSCANKFLCSDSFASFTQADEWAWRNAI